MPVSGSLSLVLPDKRMNEATVAGTLVVDNVGSRIVLQGNLVAQGRSQCSRCLADFDLTWDVPMEFLVLRDVDSDEADQETLVILQNAGEVDLVPVLQECLTLAFPLAPVCRQDCQGLCAHCGMDLNLGSCDCSEPEVDPRWEGLP